MNRKLVLLAAALAAASPVLAAQNCKPVVGHFEAVIVPTGPDCPDLDPSPVVTLCTAGRVWGGIQGEYQFVSTGFLPAGFILGIPTAFFFTGRSEIFLKSGEELKGTDSGTIDPGPAGAGGFASLISFTGGSGGMATATGQIRLRGEVSLEGTRGDYVGTLCKG